MKKYSFIKSHGLGNDYIVIDPDNIPFEFNTETIKLVCNRNYGIGSDGILLLNKTGNADFGLRILNPDGSEAEKSGNGIRIFAKYLYDHGYTKKHNFSIDTLGGTVNAEIISENGKATLVDVDMGKASFSSIDIPVEGDEREVVGEEIRVNGDIFKFTGVTVGNPHCVIFVSDLDEGLVKKVGPIIENHDIFPNRTNVQFARVKSPKEVEILIWERGAGYTLASGSSSCAVASASVRNNYTEHELKIIMPGGVLDITVGKNWSLRMKGPAEEVFEGIMSPDIIRRIETSDFPSLD